MADGEILSDRISFRFPLAMPLRLCPGYSPNCFDILQWFGAKVCKLNIDLKPFRCGEYARPQASQGHGCVAEIFKLTRTRIRLGIPESIKQSNKSGTLTRIVVQIQQLKAAETWRAQVCFNLFLVTGKLELS